MSLISTSKGGGSGKKRFDMEKVETYTNTESVGLDEAWDFENNPNNDEGNFDYWKITEGHYPMLMWQDPSSYETYAPPLVIIAFPGADGNGKNTVGGRGGQVIEVTTLDASGPGSFREACLTMGPRTIVFGVSGTIDLGGIPIIVKNDPDNHQYDNITIAGQTAPGGIQIKGGSLFFENVNQIIIR